MSSVQIISPCNEGIYYSDDGDNGGDNDDESDDNSYVRTNDNPDRHGPVIHNYRLAGNLQRARSNLSISTFMGSELVVSQKIINLVICGRLSLGEMGHLASPIFLKYLAINNPNLVDFLKDVMNAIYVCNKLKDDWYEYYDGDVFSYISVFVDQQYENFAPLPPYVDKIGSLHLPYFYDNWLRYYTIYQKKLKWVMYKAAVLKKQEELIGIKNLCRKNKLLISFKDALLNKSAKKSCIELFFKREHCLISSFLG